MMATRGAPCGEIACLEAAAADERNPERLEELWRDAHHPQVQSSLRIDGWPWMNISVVLLLPERSADCGEADRAARQARRADRRGDRPGASPRVGPSYPFSCGLTLNSATFCVSKPTSTPRRFASVRRNKPAAINTTSDTDTCRTSSALLRNVRDLTHAAAVLFHRRGHVHARCAQCGQQTERDAGQQTQRRDESEYAPVERRVLPEREQLTAPVPDEQPEQAAESGEQHAFGQQLSDQPARASRPWRAAPRFPSAATSRATTADSRHSHRRSRGRGSRRHSGSARSSSCSCRGRRCRGSPSRPRGAAPPSGCGCASVAAAPA